ncbi:hypothetical protein P3G55_02845 [Leptospira sp. 96542]|nr:hypothetical protein [Leptospira sp. 96542]
MPFFYFAILILLICPVFAKDEFNAQAKETKVEQILPESPEKGSPWGDGSLKFDEIKILDLVDETSSQNRWKEANKEYSAALDQFEMSLKAVTQRKSESEKQVYYEDRYDWQKKIRKENREKEYSKQVNELRTQLNLRLIKAMNILEKIENPKVKESEPYLDLKSGIYREYIKQQEAFKNYMQIIDFCERYMAISAKNANEAEPHRMLAISYEKMELNANKSKNQELYFELKDQKKKHLLRFAEIKYGKDSKEYLAVEEKIAKDF